MESTNNKSINKQSKNCSFCNKEIYENEHYISGGLNNVCLCNQCAKLLLTKYHPFINKNNNFINNISNSEAQTDINNLLTPSQIKAELDKYIVGQEDAKRTIATAIYNHYIRIGQNSDDIIIDKSNICLIGPTGTGKTEIARSIANLLNVPFCIGNSTNLTQAGYVGEDIESIITRLLQNCDYDVERAEHGIIFLDEFDKLAKTSGNRSITRDVSGEGVQQGLLKLIEGTDAMVPPQGGRKHPEQKLIKVNTKDILFIVSGAFVGLEDIIYDRLNEDYENGPKIGFGSIQNDKPKIDEDHLLEYVQPEDIIQFGMIPEIVGRLPIITNTNYLDKKSLEKILTEPQNAIIKQYQKLFSYSNVELTFTKGAIERIAEYAEALQTGARGLRTCVERVLKEPLFNAPDIGKEHSKKEKDTMFKLQIKKKDIDRELKDFIKLNNN